MDKDLGDSVPKPLQGDFFPLTPFAQEHTLLQRAKVYYKTKIPLVDKDLGDSVPKPLQGDFFPLTPFAQEHTLLQRAKVYYKTKIPLVKGN